jgi:PAS domain S-box-containing protein
MVDGAAANPDDSAVGGDAAPRAAALPGAALFRSAAGRRALVFGPVLVVLGSTALVAAGVRRERAAGAAVAHTHQVRSEVAAVLGRLADAETGQRGYLLTGRDSYLAPHTVARREIGTHLAALRALTDDNPRQQARVDTLERSARAKLAYLDTTVALHAGGRAADALGLVETGRGQRLMDEARRVAGAMDAEEQRLLDARRRADAAAQRRLYLYLGTGVGLALLAALVANVVLGHAVAVEAQARDALARRGEELARAQAALREALAAAQTGAWDWELARDRVTWSGLYETVMGYRPGTAPARGMSFLERVHPDDLAMVQAAVARARDGRAEYACEFRVVPSPGVVRWVAGRGRFFYDERGTPVRAAGTVTDVSDRKEAEAERAALQASLRLSETMSAIGAVTAGVAHEVRNPLFGISAVLDAMDAVFPTADELRPYTSTLRTQVTRVSDLMSDLLEYGRPAQVELAPAPLSPVLRTAVANCAPIADRHGVTVTVEEEELDDAHVLMDRRRLARVFQNLVENAVQHSPRGAVVRVRAAGLGGCAGSWAECAVEDDGAGIPPEHLARLFEPFFTKRRGGTGLGLSIVERIVAEHGGAIEAGNRAAGGARMIVRLPLVAPARGAPAAAVPDAQGVGA